ncbi:MAG: hypothetical protein EOM19_05900 [Candidatus Moranbacteria bacterium]|nr:hypothetical protein [Candidatus Moranbacteria bacterium]
MKYKEDFRGKRITVYGLGLHGGGVSTVRFLVEAGALVTVTDLKSHEQLLPSIEKLAPFEKNIRYILGQHRSEDFIKADIVMKSPAIPWNDKYIRLAQENKIKIEMDSSIFFQYWNRPIIGVTGTKGKTTTALLTARILQMMGLDVSEVGIGQTPVLDALGKMKQNSVAVFELSSWRLSVFSEIQMKKSPHIAVFKNFLPDHLNYYSTMDAYLKDKKNIFLYQKPTDWCLLNYDDPVLRDIQGEVKAQVLWFGFSRPESGKAIFIDQGWIVLDDGIDKRRIVATRELGLQGKHNILNATAAIGACWAYGVSLEKLKKRVKDEFPECQLLRLDPNDIQGIPDLLILCSNKWATLETKRGPKARRGPNQPYYVDMHNKMAFSSFVFPENEDSVFEGLKKHFGGKEGSEK